MATITITDHITLPCESATAWVELWQGEYLPGARERGMNPISRSSGYLVGGAAALALPDAQTGEEARPAGATQVTVTYTLPSVDAFWAMRLAAAQDPNVARFWEQTKAMGARHTRHVKAPETPCRLPADELISWNRWVATGNFTSNDPSAHAGFIHEANELVGHPGIAASTAGQLTELSAAPEADFTWDLTLMQAPNGTPAVRELIRRYTDHVRIWDISLLQPIAWNTNPQPPGQEILKRTLLLRGTDAEGTTCDDSSLLESALVHMPEYINSFDTWSLSAAHSSSGRFTHCWEQEFRTEDDYLQYLNHPYHYAFVDALFDPESHRYAVETGFAHMLYRTPRRVIVPPPHGHNRPAPHTA